MIDSVEVYEDDISGYILKVIGDEDSIKKVEEYAIDVLENEDEEKEDMVNHPSHYAKYGIECIHEMILLYGRVETMSFCKLNSHKYRKRAMDKGGRQDMDKSDFYIKMYAKLFVMTDEEAVEWVMNLYEDYLAN